MRNSAINPLEYRYVLEINRECDLSRKGQHAAFARAAELANNIVWERGVIYYEVVKDDFGHSIFLTDDDMLLSGSAMMLNMANPNSIALLRDIMLSYVWAHCRTAAANMLTF